MALLYCNRYILEVELSSEGMMGVSCMRSRIILALVQVFFAELSALVAALELCQQLGLSNVVVELDSQVLVTALSGRSGWPWRYHYQLVKAAHLLEQSRASIQHVYRECNAVADSLAKLATSTYQTHTFRMHDLPSYIKGLVALSNNILTLEVN